MFLHQPVLACNLVCLLSLSCRTCAQFVWDDCLRVWSSYLYFRNGLPFGFQMQSSNVYRYSVWSLHCRCVWCRFCYHCKLLTETFEPNENQAPLNTHATSPSIITVSCKACWGLMIAVELVSDSTDYVYSQCGFPNIHETWLCSSSPQHHQHFQKGIILSLLFENHLFGPSHTSTRIKWFNQLIHKVLQHRWNYELGYSNVVCWTPKIGKLPIIVM